MNNILTESGIPTKLGSLIKLCLNKIYLKVRKVKHLSYTFPTQNNKQEGDTSPPLLLKFFLGHGSPTRGPPGCILRPATTFVYITKISQ